MDSDSMRDILITLEEWRLPIIVMTVLFLAWVLWYTNNSIVDVDTKEGDTNRHGDDYLQSDDYSNLEFEDPEHEFNSVDKTRKTIHEDILNKPLSLAEEMVAIHNLRS